MNDISNLQVNEILAKRGMTKVELATLMGTTKENLNGKLKSPSFPTLVSIANALGIPMWQLFANPADVVRTSTDFTALISDGDKLLKFTSKQELKDYCNSDSFTGTVE